MDGTFASGDKTMEETSNPLSVHQDRDEAAEMDGRSLWATGTFKNGISTKDPVVKLPDGQLEATFPEGDIGLAWNASTTGDRWAQIRAVNDGLAKQMVPGIEAGWLVTSVNGQDTDGMPFTEGLQLMAQRPARFVFKSADAVAASPDSPPSALSSTPGLSSNVAFDVEDSRPAPQPEPQPEPEPEPEQLMPQPEPEPEPEPESPDDAADAAAPGATFDVEEVQQKSKKGMSRFKIGRGNKKRANKSEQPPDEPVVQASGMRLGPSHCPDIKLRGESSPSARG